MSQILLQGIRKLDISFSKSIIVSPKLLYFQNLGKCQYILVVPPKSVENADVFFAISFATQNWLCYCKYIVIGFLVPTLAGKLQQKMFAAEQNLRTAQLAVRI